MGKIGKNAANYSGMPTVTITQTTVAASGANLRDLADVSDTQGNEADTIRLRSGVWTPEALAAGDSVVLSDGSYGDVTVSASGAVMAVGDDTHAHTSATVTALGIGAATTAHVHTGTYQPLDTDLTNIAALATTAFGRALLALADQAAAQSYLGVTSGALDTGLRIYVPAASMLPTVTSGCSGPVQLETTTNKVNRMVLVFPAGSTTRAEFEFDTPSNWDAGTLTAAFRWETPGTTSVSSTFTLSCRAFSDHDPMDAAVTTGAKSVTDAATGSAGDLCLTAATAAITPAGVPAVGDTLHFRLSIAAGATTAVYLHGVYLTLAHT